MPRMYSNRDATRVSVVTSSEASLLRSVCREKSRESPVGERTKPTRELTLHPEPPGGLYLVYRLVHEPRPRQFRQGRASCKFG
jgi:hypothetical protein